MHRPLHFRMTCSRSEFEPPGHDVLSEFVCEDFLRGFFPNSFCTVVRTEIFFAMYFQMLQLILHPDEESDNRCWSKTKRTRCQSGQRLRRFIFVVNHWTPKEYKDLRGLHLVKPITWMVMAKETGENGTPHLQGACCLSSQIAFSQIKTWPGLERAHLEPMNGTPQQSLAYCSKQDSEPFVFGNLPQPGKRNDLAEAVTAVQEGATLKQLAESNGACVVKFYKGLTVLRSLLRPERRDPPSVYWLYGATGTGKTRAAYEMGQQLGGTDGVWISSGGLKWFDGYDGQPVVIFDDFRTKGLEFNFLLRLLDRYPVQVEFKGGFVRWEPRYIFITCPNAMSVAFSARKEHVPEDIAQLERRITASYLFPDDDATFRDLFQNNSELSCSEDSCSTTEEFHDNIIVLD